MLLYIQKSISRHIGIFKKPFTITVTTTTKYLEKTETSIFKYPWQRKRTLTLPKGTKDLNL